MSLNPPLRTRVIATLKALAVGGAVAACLLPLFTAGCSAPRMTVAPDPSTGVAGVYRLGAGDEVSIDVLREPDLSGTFRVDPSGSIRHPMLGSVEIGGLTPSEAEAQVSGLLGARYLVNPRVMVHVVSSQVSQIVVLGEVKTPGVRPIPFDEPVTLLQAIAMAGGFTDLASVNRVQILRNADGRQRQFQVRVTRIIAGKDPDVLLEPNDVVMVPQTVF